MPKQDGIKIQNKLIYTINRPRYNQGTMRYSGLVYMARKKKERWREINSAFEQSTCIQVFII